MSPDDYHLVCHFWDSIISIGNFRLNNSLYIPYFLLSLLSSSLTFYQHDRLKSSWFHTASRTYTQLWTSHKQEGGFRLQDNMIGQNVLRLCFRVYTLWMKLLRKVRLIYVYSYLPPVDRRYWLTLYFISHRNYLCVWHTVNVC